MSAELEVPEAAIEALDVAVGFHEPYRALRDVRAIAAPVVAAELRRWTVYVEPELAAYLMARADELDGGAS